MPCIFWKAHLQKLSAPLEDRQAVPVAGIAIPTIKIKMTLKYLQLCEEQNFISNVPEYLKCGKRFEMVSGHLSVLDVLAHNLQYRQIPSNST